MMTDKEVALMRLDALRATIERGDVEVLSSIRQRPTGLHVFEFEVISGSPLAARAFAATSVQLPCGSLVPKGWPR